MANVGISGGERMEGRLAEIAERLARAKTVRVGFLEGATYPDGTSVPMVAAIQEFGAPRAGIPPRSYFRTMVAEKKSTWPRAVAKLIPAEQFDAAAVLAKMGEGISGQLRASIAALLDPPLSEVTLMLRKMRSEDQTLIVTGKTVGEAARRVAAGESTAGVSTKPLVDSGHLLNSVDYEVS